jgi:hypothetical protein
MTNVYIVILSASKNHIEPEALRSQANGKNLFYDEEKQELIYKGPLPAPMVRV